MAGFSTLKGASFICRVMICELFAEIAALETEKFKRLWQFTYLEWRNGIHSRAEKNSASQVKDFVFVVYFMKTLNVRIS